MTRKKVEWGTLATKEIHHNGRSLDKNLDT